MMANQHLAAYLNNHMAGSVTALDLLAGLEASEDNPQITRLAGELRREIEAEQQALRDLMERQQITKNAPRQAAGWLAEKFAEIKLRMDDSKDGDLYLLESLELLLVGIEGKGGLWRAMAANAIPGLPLNVYERFAQQSQDQQRRVEAMRLAAAKAAFAAGDEEKQQEL
jgi:hypothetical protein